MSDSKLYNDTPHIPLLPKVDYTPLDDMKVEPTAIPAVSFFSGAGGMDLGFHYAGFSNLASVEHNSIFCNTLRLNNPNQLVVGPPTYSGDVGKFGEIQAALSDNLDLSIPFEGVFHGGPPCQSFSMAANQRFAKGDNNFKRVGFAHSEYGNLLHDYLRLVAFFQPRVFVVENVPGLKQMDEGQQLTQALALLVEMGYRIAPPTVLNAADYGVPQMRQRLFVVGVRDGGEFSFPLPKKNRVPAHAALMRPLEGVANHETRAHKPESVARYVRLQYGQRDQLGRVDRLDPFKPSKTVIAGGLKGGGRSHLHPFEPRTLSARESARLQTFPDYYQFTGPSARQFTQIGNAVPPLLAYRVATAIREQIFEKKSVVYKPTAKQLSLALEKKAGKKYARA